MFNNMRQSILKILTVVFFVFITVIGSAADRYWVNGTGSWNDPNHWSESSGGKSGASLPTQFDNVIFDNNSFFENGQQVIIKDRAICNDFRWDVENHKAILKSKTFILKSKTSARIDIYGSLFIGENIENEFFGGIYLMGTDENDIEIRNKLNSPLIINTTGGYYALKSDFFSENDIQIVQGNFNSNSYTIDCNSFVASGTEQRSIYLGESNVVTRNWDIENTDNIEFNAGESVIYFKEDFSKKTFKPGGLQYNKLASAGAKSIFTYEVTITPVTCSGDEDGIIKADVLSGGVQPFTYTLYDIDLIQLQTSGPIFSTTFTFKPTAAPGVSGGSYLVRISDSDVPKTVNGGFYSVFEPAPLSAGSISINTPLSCFDGSDAALEVNPTGGTVPFTYNWFIRSGAIYVPIGQTTKIATGLSQGIYRAYVDDANSCGPEYVQYAFTKPPRTDSEIPPLLVIDDVSSTSTCFGFSNGTITITAHGGKAPYTYAIVRTSDSDSSTNTIGTFTGLQKDIYKVYVIDINGCTKQAANEEILEVPNPTASITPDPASTCPSVNLSLIGNPSGGTGVYSTHSWTGANLLPLSSTSIVNPVFNYATSGSYTFTYTVTDNAGCTGSDDITVTVKVASVAPTSASVNNNNFCPGAFANITLSYAGGTLGTGAVARWYSDATFTTLVGTGQNLVIAAPAVTTTYYVRFEGDCNNTTAASVTVTIKTSSTAPTGINVSPNNICPGQSTTLTVQGGSLGSGAVWRWYTGSCGGTLVGTGASINVSPATTTTYYVRAEGDCNTTTCASVSVTVKTQSTAPTGISTDNNNFCPGGSANLTVTGGSLGTGATWRWYTVSCGGTSVGSGASISVSPIVTTTYYVRAEGDCNTTTCATTTITVKTASVAPTSATVNNNNFCPGAFPNITLSYVGGTLGTGAVVRWYSDAGLTTLVGTGQNLIIAAPAVTTTYYVRFEGDCNNTTTASVTVTVKTQSTDPTGVTNDNTNFCPGGTASLTVTGGSLGTNATWRWYSGSCGGTSVGSGTTISVSPAVTTTYYVRAEGDCNTTACANVTVTVKVASVAPTSASVDNNNFCPGAFANITLSYSGGTLGTGAVARWYSDATFTTLVGTGQNLVIAAPAVTTTYYVRFEGDCNNTTAASITVTIKTQSTVPTGISISPDNICPGQSTTLTVQGGSLGSGAVWRWYTGSCGGTLVGTGASINVSPATTTTYYVRAEGDCNTTTCASVSVTVKTQSTAPTGISTDNNNFCPGGSANLTVTGGSLGTGATWRWYTVSCGGTSVGSGASISVSPIVTTTYYVRAEGDCNTTTCATTTITVKTASVAPTSATVNNNNFCPGAFPNITLSYVGGTLGTGAVVRWYSDAGLTTLVGTGQNLIIAAPAVTTTYYVRFEGDCNNTTTASVTVTVKTQSTDPTGVTNDNTNFCPGGTASLTVTGGSLGTNATWRWYSGSCGGTSVGSGTTISVSPAVTTTYYVRAEGDCNTTACANVTVTVKVASVAPTSASVDNNNFCPGAFANITLSYSGGTLGTGAVARWYSDATFTTLVGTGQNLVIAAPAVTTTYYVRFEGDCNNTTAASITVTIKAQSVAPTSASVDHTNFCAGAFPNIILSYSGGTLGTNATARWYSDAGFTTLVGTGQNLSIVSPAVTTTNYVRFEGDCNNTLAASVTVTVFANPTSNITPDPAVTCTSVDLNINGNPLGGTIPYLHAWTGANLTLLDDPAIQSPIFNSSTSGSFSFTYTVTDNNGCIGTDNINVIVYKSAIANAGIDTTLCYGTPYYIQDADSVNCSGINWSSDGGDGSFDDLNRIDPTYTPGVNDLFKGYVDLVLTSLGNAPCGNVTDTIRVSYLPILRAAIGKPSPFKIDSVITGTPTHIEVYVKISSHDYVANLGVYLVSPLDSVVELKPNCDLLPTLWQSDATYRFYNDPLDTSLTALSVIDECDASSGTYEFSGDWKKLHGQDPANGAWRIRIVDYENWGVPGLFEEATIKFSDENQNSVFESILYADSSINIPINRYSAINGPGITRHTPQITGITTSCFDLCDGTAVLTGSGGQPPYLTYEWSSDINFSTIIATTDTVRTLCPGVYYARVTDSHGCTAIDSVTIGSPPEIKITGSTLVNNVCFGDSIGEVTLTFSGGTGALTYTYDTYTGAPKNSGENFNELKAGVYTFIITDISGCTKDTVITINQPTQITITTTYTGISCYGSANGQIEITASGGTPGAIDPYLYSIDSASTWATGNVFSPLATDTFYIAVQDGLGCIQFGDTIIMNNPDTIKIDSISVVHLICDGSAIDGEIVVYAIGGTGDLDYSINNGIDYYADSLFTGLSGGVYQIVVRDEQGCSKFLDTLVTLNGQIIITNNTIVNNVCYGDSIGEVKLDFLGGTGVLTYTYDTYSGLPKNSGETFDKLKAGSYLFTINGISGCSKDTLITITQGTEITATYNITPVTCNGGSDGQIEIIASGGLAPYNYSITEVPEWSNTTGIFAGLTGDSVFIAVRDANLCFLYSDTIEITEPNPVTIDLIEAFPVSCIGVGNDGEIIVHASGGAGTLGYSLDNVNFQISNTFTGLIPGTYSIFISDDCDTLTAIDVATITGPIPIVIDVVTITDVNTCYGDNTGTITVTASGGTGNFEYSVDGGVNYQPGNLFTGLYAGPYVIIIRDDDGCLSGDSTVNVNQPDELLITDYIVTHTSECNDPINTGQIEIITATGGTPGYQYAITGFALQASPLFVDLNAGNYTITVQDANGCEAIIDTSVVINPAMSIVFDKIDISCNGLTDGSISVNISNGTPGYTYTWSNGETTASISDLAEGEYSVTIVDSNLPNSCEATASIEIIQPEAMNILVNLKDKYCINSFAKDQVIANGAINVDPSGGTPDYSYSWTGPGGFTSISDYLTNLEDGTYNLTVTDSRGCAQNEAVIITANTIFDISFSHVLDRDTLCSYTGGISFELTTTAVDTVYWQITEGGFSPPVVTTIIESSPQTVQFDPLLSANYVMTAVNEFCYDIFPSEPVIVHQGVGLSILDDEGDDNDTIDVKVNIATHTLIGQVQNIAIGATYNWTPVIGIQNINALVTDVTPDLPRWYLLTAISTDACLETDSIFVNFIANVDASDGFSPNGDGINDTWSIENIDNFPNNLVQVFTRWGVKVYMQKGYVNNDPDKCWDGRTENGSDLPTGTYYYIIHTNEPGYKVMTGPVTIVR